MDLTKKLLDDKIERAKEVATPIDAVPLIKFMIEQRDEVSDEARKELAESLEKMSKKAGAILLDRALSDGTITEKEWKYYQNKGLDETNFTSILQGYFNRKDGLIPEKDNVIIITNLNNPMLAIRSKLEKKFNIKILDVVETVAYMKKEKEKSEKCQN